LKQKVNELLHIAIDGPAGAGKSTVARSVAERLGISYLDTGAMYRAVAWKVLASGVSPEDEKSVSDLACNTIISFGQNQSVYCDGKDVSSEIRGIEVGRVVSVIASYRVVRECLVNIQRQEAEKGSVVMDGRDIGTFVLPDASVKIYLTASADERARRRHLENSLSGIKSSLEDVLTDIRKRDQVDSGRKHAPLKPASDAILLDTTGLTPEEVADRIFRIVREV